MQENLCHPLTNWINDVGSQSISNKFERCLNRLHRGLQDQIVVIVQTLSARFASIFFVKFLLGFWTFPLEWFYSLFKNLSNDWSSISHFLIVRIRRFGNKDSRPDLLSFYGLVSTLLFLLIIVYFIEIVININVMTG